MKQEFREAILHATSAASLQTGVRIQRLWGGYGGVVRVHLQGCERHTVVVKHVQFPQDRAGELAHRRKVRSYEVETFWYQNYSTNERCRIPECLAARSLGDERLMVLEDLDAAGFPRRRTSAGGAEIKACLRWLANFHGLFLGGAGRGLWPVGTYWHLETRPDELDAMKGGALKAAAAEIDGVLNRCRFKTLVHGDAKLENFCFSEDGGAAAVDFQYVGGGCGMKDVAYLLSSCMDERRCVEHAGRYLDFYFSELRGALREARGGGALREARGGGALREARGGGALREARGGGALREAVDVSELEEEWRELYSFAWTDFQRFLLGWDGNHKLGRYSRKLEQEVLQNLQRRAGGGRTLGPGVVAE